MKNEYCRLRENSSNENPILTISCCNVRSLGKHLSDIEADFDFLNSEIILCTETQISADNPIQPAIEGYTSIFNNSRHKYSSLAAYHNAACNLTPEISLDGFSLFKVTSDKLD